MITVRNAQTSDAERVMALLSKVWEDDYVPHIWAEWVEQPDWGIVLVAEHDAEIVGTCYVDFMTNNTCWFQAMRVHPDYRRLGVGSQLTQACLERVKALGMKAAYLGIDSDNSASIIMTTRQGFRKINDFRRLIMRLPPRDTSMRHSLWRQAVLGDMDAMLDLRTTTDGATSIFACWQWEPLNYESLERNIRQESLWVWGPPSEIRAWAGFENHKPEFHLFAPFGKLEDIKAALDDLLHFIQGHDEVALEFWILDEHPIIEHLKKLGFSEEDGYTIWEYSL